MGSFVASFESFKSGACGVGFNLVHQQRVAAGDCFDLCRVQRLISDVFNLAHVQASAQDLVDHGRLALNAVPRGAVLAPHGRVLVDVNLGIAIALADDPSIPLGQVCGSPGAGDVVQCFGA